MSLISVVSPVSHCSNIAHLLPVTIMPGKYYPGLSDSLLTVSRVSFPPNLMSLSPSLPLDICSSIIF